MLQRSGCCRNHWYGLTLEGLINVEGLFSVPEVHPFLAHLGLLLVVHLSSIRAVLPLMVLVAHLSSALVVLPSMVPEVHLSSVLVVLPSMVPAAHLSSVLAVLPSMIPEAHPSSVPEGYP